MCDDGAKSSRHRAGRVRDIGVVPSARVERREAGVARTEERAFSKTASWVMNLRMVGMSVIREGRVVLVGLLKRGSGEGAERRGTDLLRWRGG